MPSLPVVGIVGHGYDVPRFFGNVRVTGTPSAYVDRVAAAGARPVVLPGSEAVGLLDLVDALVLTGGGDVDPALHGGSPECGIDVDRSRDEDAAAYPFWVCVVACSSSWSPSPAPSPGTWA